MRVLVSGGTGLVGRYIVNGLAAAGHDLTVGGRTPPPEHWFTAPVGFIPLTLEPEKDQSDAFAGVDAFVHSAFDHLPGKYRGGEGDDAARFRRLNLDGTVRLFQEAKAGDVRRCVFLSSRAVYDGLADGLPLEEAADLAPTSLYGQVKLAAEMALAKLSSSGFVTASLRLTGVYGDLRPNKWDGLFADYLAGRTMPVRAGTEVHGRDVATAVRLMLEAAATDVEGSFNVSDLTVDTQEILEPLRQHSRSTCPLPPSLDPTTVRAMETSRIAALGWSPGGRALLLQTLQHLATTALPPPA